MRLEQIDRRILGAIRFVDSTTGLPITSVLKVKANGLSFVRNLSGHYVIAGARGLEHHTIAFAEAPANPTAGSLSFEISVDDPAREYLARRHTLKLPRDPDPKNAGASDSLFRATEVRLFPSATAATGVGWAVIRANVVEKDTNAPLPGALLRVTKRNGAGTNDTNPLGVGMTDKRGEALVTVPGIPVTTFGESAGAVTTNEIAVTITAFFDPNTSAVPDPDDLESRRANLKSAKIDTELGSGRIIPMKFEITLS